MSHSRDQEYHRNRWHEIHDRSHSHPMGDIRCAWAGRVALASTLRVAPRHSGDNQVMAAFCIWRDGRTPDSWISRLPRAGRKRQFHENKAAFNGLTCNRRFQDRRSGAGPRARNAMAAPQAAPRYAPATMSPRKWKSAPMRPIATSSTGNAHNRPSRGHAMARTIIATGRRRPR